MDVRSILRGKLGGGYFFRSIAAYMYLLHVLAMLLHVEHCVGIY